MTSPDDKFFSQATALRDGTPAQIRVLRPDDKDRMLAAFGKLERESIYTRFFSFKQAISDADFLSVANSDFVNRAALVVTTGTGPDESIIGSGSYVADTAPDGARIAEVAFTVEEDFHGQGLASRLFAALAEIARNHGITRLEADVLAGNAAMLTVFQHSGLPVHKRSMGGVVHLVLDLAQDPGRGGPAPHAARA